MYVQRLRRGIVSPCVRPFLLVWPWPPLQLSAFQPAVWDVLGVFHLRHPTVLGPVKKKIQNSNKIQLLTFCTLHNFHQWTVNNFIPNIYNFLISAFYFFCHEYRTYSAIYLLVWTKNLYLSRNYIINLGNFWIMLWFFSLQFFDFCLNLISSINQVIKLISKSVLRK